MNSKEPVLLVVLIETADLRWYVGGVGLGGDAVPLVRSAAGDLEPYIGRELDEQVSFLRHRLAGVLQRGCDRLWAKSKKPVHIVFIADGPFVQASMELTQRVGEHFAMWMTSPPVVFYVGEGRFRAGQRFPMKQIAGQLNEQYRGPLEAGLPALVTAHEDSEAWETLPEKKEPPAPE